MVVHNVIQLGLHCTLLASAIGALFGGPEYTLIPNIGLVTLLRFTQTTMLTDVANSAVGAVKSNITSALLQIASRICVAFFGSDTYFPYLAIVWAISDIVRYGYHSIPKSLGWLHTTVKEIRYSQYVILYPLGVALETIAMFPALPNAWARAGFVAMYAVGFPKMYNHTAKLQMNRRILDTLNRFSGSEHNYDDLPMSVMYRSRVYTFDRDITTLLQVYLGGARLDWKCVNETTLELRDFGLQVSWRTVYIVEYLGALVAYPLMIWCSAVEPVDMFQRVDIVMWVVHYTKRLYESCVVHSFSASTMPFENIFKNCLYYWGAGWVLGTLAPSAGFATVFDLDVSNAAIACLWTACLAGNMYAHAYLAGLRVGSGGKRAGGHLLPRNRLFRVVVCPNYGFEILGWFLFACLNANSGTSFAFIQYTCAKLVFCLVGAVQMYVWAGGKKRRYEKLFGDKYKTRCRVLPGC